MSNTPDSHNLLLKRSLVLTERLLGLCDRRPSSPTAGCFDRYYWCYKMHDLANTRFQEAAQFLATALPHYDEGSKPGIVETTISAIQFWARNRNTDGSVNEAYPFERSFCATSMSAAAVCDAWLRLDTPPEVDFDITGKWLMSKENPEVANQMAGATLALERISRITGNEKYSQGAKDKFDRLADHQLENGCYGEYGGADIGYASITLSLLAKYHQLSGGDEVLASMNRCAEYLESQVDDNGLYEWQSTSRRTQFLYPFGLAYLKSPVFERLLNGLARNVVINPLWMDDRYCIPLATDYLLCVEAISLSQEK